MTTYYLNGTPLQEGSPIFLNGFTYPYSWLESTSPSVRASYGIEKTGDINYDTKYYWGVGNPKNLEDREEVDQEGNPLYVKILGEVNGEPAMVDSEERLVTKGLKNTCLEEIKSTTNNLLQPTDYYIVRNAVEELEIPESVTEYRAAVIVESARIQEAIPAVTTVEELIELMNSANFPEVK